ncbi:MAG TPA: glycolate oxidase subunit GlcF [Gammaproteobacteria bacterium]|nr:glycolate oxidase subunit GlcF [Gammaproteobacteria bacterium]
MQTRFTPAQLADPGVAASEPILRKCVHCGFCTATCPTYVLLGDELDSPRGRIYLIKEMLENDRPATAEVAVHVDRCLSCLACMTTCPSGVHYQHLIDHARVHVERTYRRPAGERALRALLAAVLPHPRRFRAALALVPLARPFARALPKRLRAMLELAPRRGRRREAQQDSRVHAAEGSRRARVGLLTGCVQTVLAPSINAATIRVLARAGCEVVPISGCCGSLVHHLGRERETLAFGARVLEQVEAQLRGGGLDALVANASGCGTHAKDFGHLFRDHDLRALAAAVSTKSRDVTELLAELGLPPPRDPPRIAVAYHSACSMQHGQKLDEPPRALLRQAGYDVREIAEGHLCCGSAGTYNILQPALAARLRDRKLANVARTGAAAIATGNVGCIAQLAAGTTTPVVHTVELLDWATGGPVPPALERSRR